MADETRERSTTSAGLWPEAVLSDLASTNRWLYFMKGTGSDRDKRLALGVLLEWLGSHSGPITIQGQDGTATLTNLLLTLAATGNLKVVVSASGVTVTQTNGSNSVTITKDGVTVGMNGGAVTIGGNSVTVAGGGKTVEIGTDSVSVTEGDYSATIKKNSVEVAYGDDVATVIPESVEVTDGNKTTYVYSDKVQSECFLSYVDPDPQNSSQGSTVLHYGFGGMKRDTMTRPMSYAVVLKDFTKKILNVDVRHTFVAVKGVYNWLDAPFTTQVISQPYLNFGYDATPKNGKLLMFSAEYFGERN